METRGGPSAGCECRRRAGSRANLLEHPGVGDLETGAKRRRRFPTETIEDHRVVAVATTDTLGRAEIVAAFELDPRDPLDDLDQPLDRDELGGTEVDGLFDVAVHDLLDAMLYNFFLYL